MYDVFKDFAGPVATIIAAGVAVFVTDRLGNDQQRIAQQQAETAKRRLNLDLYDKRFNIYATILDLYEADMKKGLADIEAAELPFVQAFRESLFLFEGKDGIYDTLNAIKNAHNEILAHERDKLKVKNEYDESARVLSDLLAKKGAQGRKDFETLLMTLEGQLAKYLDFGKIT